jgi:UDP-glucose 4-epimerase
MLTVAVTGPTGEIGRAFLAELEREPRVGRVIGMARRPFDPAAHGWRKVEYRRGDILDREAVEGLVADTDVVVHLAFVIVAGRGDSREINLSGSRNVFEATAAAGTPRLVYTSSVAAYGFHSDAPQPLGEDTPARGSARHPYSAHKAEVEIELAQALGGSATEAYVFRPCIVAGPDAPRLVELVPLLAVSRRLPRALRRALDRAPALRPVLPDPGVPFQLVHHDDVATALRAAVVGEGEPGRLQPRRAGRADDLRSGPRAGLARRAGAAARGRRRRRGDRPPSAPAGGGRLDRGGSPSRARRLLASGNGAGLGTEARRSGDPEGDGRRRQGLLRCAATPNGEMFGEPAQGRPSIRLPSFAS